MTVFPRRRCNDGSPHRGTSKSTSASASASSSAAASSTAAAASVVMTPIRKRATVVPRRHCRLLGAVAIGLVGTALVLLSGAQHGDNDDGGGGGGLRTYLSAVEWDYRQASRGSYGRGEASVDDAGGAYAAEEGMQAAVAAGIAFSGEANAIRRRAEAEAGQAAVSDASSGAVAGDTSASTPTITTTTSTTPPPPTTIQQQAQPTSKRPNILFLLLDQWRYDWDGSNDHVAPNGAVPLRMPFLNSLAAAGTRFRRAYVPSPLCAPSRACLASGKEYDHSGMPTNKADQYPTDQTTFYKLLRDGGKYHVMSCGKDDLFKNDVRFPYYPDSAATAASAADDHDDRKLDALSFEERYPDDWGHGDDDEWDWVPPSLPAEGQTFDVGAAATLERELNPLNPALGVIDLGFSDAIRSAGKTKVVRQIEPYEPYRLFLEKTQVRLNDGTPVKAFDVYEACWDGTANTIPGRMCDSSGFTSDTYPDDFVKSSAVALLGRKPSDQPWFMQVNFPGPHPPIMATATMADSVRGRNWPQPVDAPAEDVCPQDKDGLGSGPRNGGRCNYGAQIENIDRLMQDIVSAVPPLERENTLICVSGDHGEMLGDHGQWGKTKPWTGSSSVPLICAGPGVARGVIRDDPVATLDLPGTFLDYAGVEERAEGMTTRSLRPFLEWSEEESRTKLVEKVASAAAAAEEDETNAVSRLEEDGGSKDIATTTTMTTTVTANVPSLSAAAIYRDYVSSGLANWRMVVRRFSQGGQDGVAPTSTRPGTYKLVCCRGPCDGAPASAAPIVESDFHLLLFDVEADPFDRTNIAGGNVGVLEEMRGHLPNGWCPKA